VVQFNKTFSSAFTLAVNDDNSTGITVPFLKGCSLKGFQVLLGLDSS